MDEPQHTNGRKPDVVSLCPFCICTTIGNIRGEHCPQIGHLLTTFALGKPFGIHGTLLCFRIKKLAPGVQVDNKKVAVHYLLVTTKTTLRAFGLPGGVTGPTHGSSPQKAA